MKHRNHRRSRILGGGFCLLLVAGVAGAQAGGTRAHPPAGSGGATTSTHNFPAAAAATTSQRSHRDARSQTARDANPRAPATERHRPPPETRRADDAPPVNPAPRGNVRPEGKLPPVAKAPSNGAPSEGKVAPPGWQMGSQGTLIQLEELAPVEVIDLQERLKAMNLYYGALDGVAGPLTRQALQQYFIKQAQLALQGQVDASALNLFDVIPTAQTEPL